MRSFISILLIGLAALTTLTSAASFTATCVAEICGGTNLELRAAESIATPTSTLAPRELTNAQRLSLGLPLKRPSRRHRGAFAARAQVSATPKYTVTGVVQVKRSSDGVVLGVLDTNTNANGMFTYTTTLSSALKISITLDVGDTADNSVEITMLNSAGPLLGLVQGRDNTDVDIAAGSFHYLYLNGVTSPGTEPGSAPVTLSSRYSTGTSLSRAAETSVWNIDLTTGALSAQWVNSDLSYPTTVFWSQSGYMYAGGDPSAFVSRYPSAITALTLTFVQDAPEPI